MSLCLLDFAFPCYPWSECFLDGEPPHYSGDLTSRTTRSLNLRRHELQFIHRNTVRPLNALKEPLPTVTSPVFSEIVLCSSRKACFGHCRETCVARDVWNHTVSRGILFGDIGVLKVQNTGVLGMTTQRKRRKVPSIFTLGYRWFVPMQ